MEPLQKPFFENSKTYSAQLETGLSTQYFKTGTHAEVNGYYFKSSVGLSLLKNPQRHSLYLKLFYEEKRLGNESSTNSASAHTIGVEMSHSYKMDAPWLFSLGDFIKIGYPRYSSRGAEFESHATHVVLSVKEVMDLSVEGGFRLCSWGNAVCLGLSFFYEELYSDTNLLIDNKHAYSYYLSYGAKLGIGLDFIRLAEGVHKF
jgi:hypothetical protein